MVNVFHVLWDGNLGGIQRVVESAFLSQVPGEVTHHALLLKDFGEVIKDGPNRWALHARNGFDSPRLREAFRIFSQYRDPILHFHNDCRLLHHMCRGRFRTVVTEHGEIFFHPTQRKFFDLLLGSHYLNAHAICGVSNYVSGFLLDRYPAVAGRTRVIQNPLLGKAPGTPDFSGPFSLGYIGRLSREKGVCDLVPLCRAFPETPFYIIGDGPLMPQLRRDLKDCTNAVLTGFVEDISSFLDKITLLVAPSYLESFNMAIVEAMAHGVPAVAYETGGIPEIINHGENGWLVPTGDIGGLTDLIGSLAADRKKLERLAGGLRKTVAEKFSLSRYRSSYHDLYRSL